MRRSLAAAVLALYVLALAAATLGDSPERFFRWATNEAHRVEALKFLHVGDVERTLNVALFVPAGILLCLVLARTSRWVAWLLCVLASVAVEAVQYYLPGRDSSAVDVLMNTAGATIGVLLHAVFFRRARQPSTG